MDRQSSSDKTASERIIEMKIDAASYSALGKRKNNEDAYFAGKGNQTFLALVCDGVGGSNGGEIASVQSSLAKEIGLLNGTIR